MEFSDSFTRKVKRLYTSFWCPDYLYQDFSKTGYSHLLEIDLTSETLYCPMFSSPGIITNHIEYGPVIGKFIYPLGEVTSAPDEVSGADTFISKIIGGGHRERILPLKFRNGNDVYYTIPGLIMDSSFNILVDYGFVGTKQTVISESTTKTYYKYARPYFRVGYKVFEDPSLTLNKYIVSKMIPYMLSKPYIASYSNIARGGIRAPEVIIEKEINILTSPAKPTIKSLNNEEIRDFLLKSSMSIVDGLENKWY